MNLNSKKIMMILSVVTIFLMLIGLYLMFNWFQPTELLLAWGWQGNADDRSCIFQIINPNNQESGPVHTNDKSCNYQIVNIQGKSRLVWEQTEPRAIIIYVVTANGDLIIENVLPIEGVTSTKGSLNIQFGNDGAVYFGGILDNANGVIQDRMQLLQMDPETGQITSLTAHKEGMVDLPIVSPDGTYLVYSVFNGLKTWADCRGSCASHYYLMERKTNSIINLSSLVNHLASDPKVSHCGLHWSPNGRFIAFNLGCESEPTRHVAIFDVENNEVVTVIKSDKDASDVSLVGWLSNNELVYGQSVSKEGYDFYFYRYFIYSLVTDTSNELTAIPLTNSEDLGLVIQDVTWTSDGEYLAAAVHGWDETGAPLLVMNIDSELSQINYITPDTFNERPLWSTSGDWIAYISSKNLDTWYDGKNAVKITDPAGQMIFDTEISGDMIGIQYSWLQP